MMIKKKEKIKIPTQWIKKNMTMKRMRKKMEI